MKSVKSFLKIYLDAQTLAILYFINNRFTRKHACKFQETRLILTYANAITVLGIMASIGKVLAVCLNVNGLLIPLFQIAVGISDMLDGYVAEKCNQRSRSGQILDYSRDRTDLLASLVVVDALYGNAALSFVMPILIFESIIFVFGHVARIKYGHSGGSHCAGKIRMSVYQSCTFVMLVQVYWLHHVAFQYALLPLCLMALASEVVFLKYIHTYLKKASVC